MRRIKTPFGFVKPIRIKGIVIGEHPKTKLYCYKKVLIKDDEGTKFITIRKGLSPEHYVVKPIKNLKRWL